MTTKIPVELSSTPGIVDGSNATAITIDSSERVGIGTASPDVPLDILTNLSSDTTSTPDTVLTLSTKYASTSSDGAAGAGPRLEFKIPDDETNPITGAAIAGIKEVADDSDASAGMAFYVSQNDTTLDEAMRIDHDSRLLLQHATSIANGSLDDLEVGSGSGNTGMTIYSGTANYGGIAFADGNSGATQQYAGLVEYFHNQDAMQFYTGAGLRLKLDGYGLALLGSSSQESGDLSATQRLYLEGNESVMMIKNTSSDSSANRVSIGFLDASGTRRGYIHVGTDGSGLVTTSDYRLKENVTPMEKGLERLLKLKPVKYKWKESESYNEGFLAHEIQEAGWDCTQTVMGKKDAEEMQSVDYGRITPLLVKAIQEQQEQIEQLKTEIQTLKGE